jgi:cellulose synthase/poly-beta-1,6-N-acetylglucosamine synthase-like glycosyltransferase
MVDALILSRKEKSILFLLLAIFTFAVMFASFFLPNIILLVAFNSIFLFALLFYLILFLNKSSHGAASYPKTFPSVSIIIPMYNSKNTLKACIESVKKIKWPGKLEIVVVDDCSTDGSREILKKFKGIKVITHKKNSGKAIALNNGFSKSNSEFVVCIDSDSYPEEDILLKTVGYFEDKNVAAVTCLVLPDKKDLLIQKIQHIEYLAGFGLNNTLLSSISSSYVIPGPYAILRKSVFESVGYFQQGNLAEDMEFGLRLKKHGLKIISCFDAVVYTDIPNNWRGLFKQRDRWCRGGIFNFIKYRELFFNKKNPDFGFFMMPFLFATQILTVAIVLRALIFLLNDFFLSASIIFRYFLLGGFFYIDLSNIILPSSIYFFAGTYLIVILYFLLAFKLTKRKISLGDVPILLMLMFIYPYFITLIYSQSYFKEMLGVKGKWLRVSM